jgi:hypothetical protein
MKRLIPLLFVLLFFYSSGFVRPVDVTVDSDSYWILFKNDSNQFGYLNSNGDTMIPAGKYLKCYTDTFRSYAIVRDKTKGMIGINKLGKVLYGVFTMWNEPDPVSEGRFRIIKNGLIGFADERTGKVMIYPQYKCAFPYENGVADVSFDCEITLIDTGEGQSWSGGQWYYINHAGKKAPSPEH